MLVVIATILLLFSLTRVFTIPTPEDSTIEEPIRPREFAFAAANTPDAVNVEGLANNNEECGRLQDVCVERCTAIRAPDACITEVSKKAADCRFAIAKNETYSFSFVYPSDGIGNDDNNIEESPDGDDASLFSNLSSISRATKYIDNPIPANVKDFVWEYDFNPQYEQFCKKPPKDMLCKVEVVMFPDNKTEKSGCGRLEGDWITQCEKKFTKGVNSNASDCTNRKYSAGEPCIEAFNNGKKYYVWSLFFKAKHPRK
ncbi:hypothetical protein HDU96_009793 [Phlyctochytrium bullatum]|nr:hypothetical protein HDU96_009793 [Phlyctochytrium bullatum]